MAVALTAIQCPPVQVLTQSLYQNTAPDTSAFVAHNFAAAVDFRQAVNQNFAMLDQTARYGAGTIGVPDGLTKITLSAGSTLTLAVSGGHAMIGGPVEIVALGTTLAVPDNRSRVWIWLQQTGAALTYTTNLTPPAGECCLIGNIVTVNGTVGSVDYSGVMYLRGGVGWRQTADLAAPTDTPPSNIQFIAQTVGGTYWWDGSSYLRLPPPSLLASLTAQGSDSSDRLDTIERKFRAVLLYLADLTGGDVLITDELSDDLDTASSEA